MRDDENTHHVDSAAPETSEAMGAGVGSADTEVPRSETKQGWLAKLRHWIMRSKAHMAITGLAAALVVGGVAVGATDLRYSVAGIVIKTQVSLIVTDTASNQPVPKAAVEMGGDTGTTDSSGKVVLKRVRPGTATVVVRKSGYRDATKSQRVGFRKLDVAVGLEPNGIRVAVLVNNLITAGKIQGVEVKAGEASAITNDEGRAELSLPVTANGTSQTLTFSKDAYNELKEDVDVKPGVNLQTKLTPSGKVVFQSNRNGKLDIYQSDLDGSKAEVILAATGNEDEQTGILPNVSNPRLVALVSSREGRRDGALHHDLFIFDTQSKAIKRIEKDVEFGNYRAWLGQTLVYAKGERTSSYPFYNCNSIRAYDAATSRQTTVVAGSLDTGCPEILTTLRDGILYSVTLARTADRAGYFTIKLGAAPRKIAVQGANTTVRRSKQTLLAEYYNTNSAPTWDSIDLSSLTVARLPNGPASEVSRYYNDSPSGDYSSFIEERDGKRELYLTDSNGGNEKKLTSMGSVNQFVQWYSDEYIVFSSSTSSENALYIVSTKGGSPVKVADFFRANSRTYGGGGNPYN